MKSDESRPTRHWIRSSLALIAAAALSLSALSIAQAAVSGVADDYTAYVDSVLSVDAANGVLANDSGDNLTAELEVDATNGTVVLAPDGAFSYTPNAGFVGTDTFKYILSGVGGIGHVGVTLDVVDGTPPAGDPPADDPPADEPPVDEQLGLTDAQLVCEDPGHPSLIALCSAADFASARASDVLDRVIVAQQDRLAGLNVSGLRGHGRR